MGILMDSWEPGKYLQFKDERTRPAVDLVGRIDLSNPKNIIDIGCGPGNSTQILAKRWPESVVVGLDSSENMIEKARRDYPNRIWIQGDAENITGDKTYSLVFSNAALQWMDNHEALIPKLWGIVEDGGVFAVQIPKFETMPVNTAIQNVLKKDRWKNRFVHNRWEGKNAHGLAYYYEIVSALTCDVVLWETHYVHVLPGVQSIVDFVRSTALMPYFEEMESDRERQQFEQDILAECETHYRAQTNGKVLFPFERMFIIAYKTRAVGRKG
ncbi:MAG: methyltransferase domain-containing protein [Spirochaetaceae bacterium]|jgi:trans-aconitate 2-methyltransferase|nr:methyltransferase domain-containing protein [Spirochaetaceae bacterium]